MKRNKDLCEICQKKKAKYKCDIEGEHLNKCICGKCFDELLLQDGEIREKRMGFNKFADTLITFNILISICFVISCIITYFKVFTEIDEVVALFTENHRVVYFVVFVLFNFFINKLVQMVSDKIPKWLNIVLEILLTCLTTFVGALAVFKEDISWNYAENPLIYGVSIIMISSIILLCLKRFTKVDKRKLFISSIVLQLITVVFVCVEMYIILT